MITLNTFTWERCVEYDNIKEIFESVIFDQDCWDKQGMLTKHPDWMRGYISRGNMGKGQIIACAVIARLPNTGVMHVDCFAISDTIRGQHLSYIAWSSFLEFVSTEWNELSTRQLLIEVYLPNIDLWRKIMKVEILNIDNLVIKQKVKSDVVIMGKELNTELALEAYKEWQFIENNW